MKPPEVERPGVEATDEEAALRDEERRLRRMRILLSLTTQSLYLDSALSLREARQMVVNLRGAILRLFPGQEGTFEIVLRPRLERVLLERWGEGLEPRVN